MFFLKAAYCRIFQGAFRLALPVLPYREPEIIGGCAELIPVMEKEHIRCPLIVTDRGIVEHGLVGPLADILERHGLRWGIYDRTQPNPTVDNVEQALNMYRELGIPRKLPGIQKEDISPLARHAEKEANPLYPVPRLMTQRELEEIYYDIADWSDGT